MFEAHIAFSAGFISLIVGLAFLIWLKKQNEQCRFAKCIGWLVVFFSITGLLCTTYYALRYWNDGYFRAPFVMTHDQTMGAMSCPMATTPTTPQNHEQHHP